MKAKLKQQKTPAIKRLEAFLLTLCLCVLALRATYIESPLANLPDPRPALTGQAFSLIISSVLIMATIAWFVFAFCSKKATYRFSGIEIAAVLFFIAGIIGILVASNKRAAITDMVTLLAPMLMAILLIQILDNSSKIRLVLFTALALAVATTFLCGYQFLWGNDEMVADYESEPQKHLDTTGAKEGSFEHMLYEHRIYSKDVRGFLTTSNSTGSFLLITAFAAVGLLIDQLKHSKGESTHAIKACLILAVAITLAGMAFTHSKGAIAAGLVCAVMFTTALLFGRTLYKYRLPILIVIIIAVVAVSFAVISYGKSHGTLPGGASMLVRWQYWDAAARMYADKPLTGVGGGNFASYYPQYKIPAALETVKDPHNFILNLLSQYGPLGLIAFAAAIAIILFKTVTTIPLEINNIPTTNAKPWQTISLVSLALLTFRPILLPSELGNRPDVMIYVITVLYIAPVAAFAVAFWLLHASQKDLPAPSIRTGNATRIALFCAIVAVLIHNLIDFAIFEPAVLTLFWAAIACLFAIDSQHKNRNPQELTPSRTLKFSTLIIALTATIAYFQFAIIPVTKAASKTQHALRNIYDSHASLDKAAQDDPLCPRPLNLGAKAYLQHYIETGKKQTALLKSAADRFSDAIARDKANFKNYDKLAKVYEMLAQAATGATKTHNLQIAFEKLQQAVELYPGSGELNLRLAKIAEQIDKNEIALDHYRITVQIEDSYRIQFHAMYPGRELFSRLGEENYQFAKEQLN